MNREQLERVVAIRALRSINDGWLLWKKGLPKDLDSQTLKVFEEAFYAGAWTAYKSMMNGYSDVVSFYETTKGIRNELYGHYGRPIPKE